MKKLAIVFFYTVLVFQFAIAQEKIPFKNITIHNYKGSDYFAPFEPSICVNPKNPAQIVAGSVLNNYYISQDSGKTWEHGKLESKYGVWGDPCIVVDTSGSFYYFHLSKTGDQFIDRMVCQKLEYIDSSWTDGVYFGLNGRKAQDKEWATVNRKNNEIYVTWTQFDQYESKEYHDSTHILFSKSVDAGKTWTFPVKIDQFGGDCLDRDKTVEGAVPAVGPNGEIFVAWTGPKGIFFDKSLDGGKTWLDNDVFVADMPGGWYFDIPGIYRSNGLPIITCDTSKSKHNGTIYINWADQRNGVNNTDIWLSKSSDNGKTWSAPKKINDDKKKKAHQFFTWMTIDQTTGYLYFVFYDRRNYRRKSSAATDVYLAISKDGGETFENIKISEKPFHPTKSKFFGDYTNISAHNGVVRPIWTSLDNGKFKIMTAIINLNQEGND